MCWHCRHCAAPKCCCQLSFMPAIMRLPGGKPRPAPADTVWMLGTAKLVKSESGTCMSMLLSQRGQHTSCNQCAAYCTHTH